MFFLSSADFFQNQLFRKILSGLPLECQTVWITDQARQNVGPDLCPNCLQRLSADDQSRELICWNGLVFVIIWGCWSDFLNYFDC